MRAGWSNSFARGSWTGRSSATKAHTGAAKGTIRSNTDGTVRGGFTITRADVAAYLLSAIDDAAVIRKTVVVAS